MTTSKHKAKTDGKNGLEATGFEFGIGPIPA